MLEYGPSVMMKLVQKFGGTSVGTVESIKNVAEKVRRTLDQGNQVAVVLSAMAGETDRLIMLVNETAEIVDYREYDTVIAAGEQVSVGLLSMRLREMGIEARSYLGWQLPIFTDNFHGKARITKINCAALQSYMESGGVPVVAGFQGVGPENRISTLGRGGSDTSAVALAVALEADRCDIFTDVDGVYTSDPRIVAKAKKLKKITYEEMLEMASLGTKVLETRAVEMAMKYSQRLQVLSSFGDQLGTLVVDEDEIVEQEIVSGISFSRNEAKITLVRVKDEPGVAASIFGPLAKANLNVDMIVQNTSASEGATDITFTVPQGDLKRALEILTERKNDIKYEQLDSDPEVAKVSVIGVGMRSHAGVAQKMFEALAEKGINIQVISTSEIKVSVLIAEAYTELAVRTLHSKYGLE